MEAVQRDIIIEVYYKEQNELYRHLNQIGDSDRQWYNKSGEIDLAKNILIGIKGVGTFGKTVGKIVPTNQTRQIEDCLRHTVCGNTCDASKHKHKHDGGKDGLDDKP
jgi:hypothetical protein